MCLSDVMAPMTRCDRGSNDNRDTTKAPPTAISGGEGALLYASISMMTPDLKATVK